MPAAPTRSQGQAHAQPRRPVWAVAHRGEPKGCVENTLGAIVRALELRASAVEVDVRCTADGVPVLHHDESLKRVWQHPGELARMTFDMLRGVRPSIPTLAEALDAMSPASAPLVVDVTSERAALSAYGTAVEHGAIVPGPIGRRVLRHSRGEQPEAKVWFCGKPRALARLRALDDDVVLMLSWDKLLPPSASLVDAVRPTFFNPWHRLLSPQGVRRWHGRGTLVSAWTVDDPARRRRLISWGVDAIISNDVAETVSQVHAAARR